MYTYIKRWKEMIHGHLLVLHDITWPCQQIVKHSCCLRGYQSFWICSFITWDKHIHEFFEGVILSICLLQLKNHEENVKLVLVNRLFIF